MKVPKIRLKVVCNDFIFNNALKNQEIQIFKKYKHLQSRFTLLC